ncbi:Integral membrane protein 2C [Entomophthora muscae]|uniref:Integral membrane protein 2C n=2 Tax=Entomophthora muscae TaxID=34485 RepID=A0ACC2S238_9FUNG|nr:Integral membrane protein 2C [Entomophthora muscae]KAJ9068693.1 Integral membrane protein 2C [Entomophthora muscae]
MESQNNGAPRAAPGNCSAGGWHEFADSYTMCGILWAVICFPVGIICCYGMREQKCRKCLTIVES